MKMLSYRLKYDGYGLLKLFICFAAIGVVGAGFLLSTQDPYELRKILFLFFDLILPAMFALLVLLVFGRDFTKENLSFVFSLPIGMGILVLLRYLRLLLLFLAACAPLFGVFLARLKPLEPAFLTAENMARTLGHLLPTLVGLGGISLFLLIGFRSPFIPSIIVFGILLFDFCTSGGVLGCFSLMVNYFNHIENPNLLLFNRIFYAVCGGVCPLMGWLWMLCRSKGMFGAEHM